MGGFDDYTLAGEPAVGLTGAVSRATHLPSGRPVLVTELTEAVASDDAFLGRLRSTAKALSIVSHPNAMPICEVVEGLGGWGGAGRVWVVEDLLDGRALSDVLTDGPLTPEQSVSVACGVLRGLAAMHVHGVLHGDVSPATIVVTAEGVAKLVGFGFAGIPGSRSAHARTDALAVATVLRQLLAGATSPATHTKVDKAVAWVASDDAKRRPVNAAALLSALEKAARSDYGKGWETTTSLAALATFPATGAEATLPPPPRSADATQELPAEATQDLAVEGLAVEDAAVEDAAVEDAAVEDPAVEDPAEPPVVWASPDPASVEETPADPAPVDASLVHAAPAAPADTAPAEETPADTAPAETAPADTAPAYTDTAPALPAPAEAPVVWASPDPSSRAADHDPSPGALGSPAPAANPIPVDLAPARPATVDPDPVVPEPVDHTPVVSGPAPVEPRSSAVETPPTVAPATVVPAPSRRTGRKEPPPRSRSARGSRRPAPAAKHASRAPTPVAATRQPVAPTAVPKPPARGPRQAPAPAAAPQRARRSRRSRSRTAVRSLAGVIMILLGVGAAVAVTRNQEADRRATAASGSNGASDAATPTTEGSGSRGPTLAEIAASDITGTWAMQLVVIESTGFFGTQVGTSVDKTYTITSDCSKTPCAFKLGVSGTPGEFALRREADDYILSEAGPNDCIDLPTGAIKVPRGGVATVVVHLRPTAATRTLRGDWTASGLLGSVLTTFDTTDPGCVQGSGRQRSTAVGTRP